MSRGKKMIALLGVLIVLCVATFAVSRMDLNAEVVEETPSVSAYSIGSDAVVSALSWTYNDETLTFCYADETWSYADDESFPLDSTALESMISVLSDVTASRTLEDVEDLSEYGLDAPQASVTVTTDDGTTTLDWGNESTLGDGRYLSIGDGNVYLATDLLSYFTYELYDLVSMESLPSMTQVTDFTIDAETQTLSLVYLEESGLTYTDALVWFAADEEGYTALDTDLAESLIAEISAISWVSCENYNATDDDLAAYGLDSPTATVTLNYTCTEDEETSSGTLVVEIGGYYSDSYCYARLGGSSMVYLVAASISDDMLYTTTADLLNTDILELDLATLESVDVTIDETTYTVVRSVTTEEDEDGETTETVTYLLDGEEISFASVLSTLNSLASTDSSDDVSAERSALVSFTFHRSTDSFSEVTLVFYAYDSSACLVSLDGETRLFTSRSDVDDLITTMEALFTPDTEEE